MRNHLTLVHDADRKAVTILRTFYKNKPMKLTTYERLVLQEIAYCLDLPNGECYYSAEKFYGTLEISRAQFFRATKNLKELDLIEVYYIKKRRTPNYRFGATLLLFGN